MNPTNLSKELSEMQQVAIDAMGIESKIPSRDLRLVKKVISGDIELKHYQYIKMKLKEYVQKNELTHKFSL